MDTRPPSIRSHTLRFVAAPAAWTLFIAIPAAGWGWLDGLPLGWFEAATLAAVWWIWAARRRRLDGARLLATLVLAKLLLAGLFVERGFVARYYANDSWQAPIEPSIEFRGAAYTRRDERLVFGMEGASDLPLYFFNEGRFDPNHPQRERLAYSAQWNGFLRSAPESAETAFYLEAGSNASIQLSIDGRPVLPFGNGARQSSPVRLEQGWHALAVTVTAPDGGSRRIEAGEIVAGTRRPFDRSRVFVRPVGSGRLVLDRALGWLSRVVSVVLLAWLALCTVRTARSAWREARVLPLLWLGALIEALLFARAYAGRLVVFRGGNDWLTYESFARVIALGDVIGAGQGGPFYYQPLYPYFVALTHVVFGEGLFGVVLVQRVLLAATITWSTTITNCLFGGRAGWIALLGGGVFLYAKGGRWTEVLLSEPLFMPLLVGWIALLVTIATVRPSWPRVAGAGVVGGVATLTRPTLMAAWPPTIGIWWASIGWRRGRAVAALLIVMLAVVNLAAIRNWIVAETFAVTPASFGPSLALGNQPTRPLEPPSATRTRVYDRFGFDANVRVVAEFAVQAPGDFARGLGNKALYTVGFFGWSGLPGGIGTSWLYVGMWLLAIAGAIRLRHPRVPRWNPAVWLPAAGALSHAAPLILVFPHGYRDRLILPLYPLLIPYAAHAIDALVPVSVRIGGALAQAVPTVAVALRGHVRRLAAFVREFLQERRNWAYVAYASVVTYWLSGEMRLAALLLPTLALASARLMRSGLVHRVAGGMLVAAALARVAMAGSQSPNALNDPLFWGVVALATLGGSAATSRWPRPASVLAAISGACTTTAVLLPLFPDFESGLPQLNADASLRMLDEQIGPVAAMCLLGIWLQTILSGAVRQDASRRVTAAARGALVAALILLLAGGLPGTLVDPRFWFATLGVLVGLVEAQVRGHPAAGRVRQGITVG